MGGSFISASWKQPYQPSISGPHMSQRPSPPPLLQTMASPFSQDQTFQVMLFSLRLKSFTPSLTSTAFHIHCYHSNSDFNSRTRIHYQRLLPDSFIHPSITLSLRIQMSLPEHHYLHVTLTYQPSVSSYCLQTVVQENIKSMDSGAGLSGLQP